MWQVDVPLGEFYDAIVSAGRRANYLALITTLVREADSNSFYEDISRYWDSLHDVTGPDILFVLAGPDASSKVKYHGVPDGREPIAYSSKNAAVVSNRQKSLKPSLSHWAAKAGTSVSPTSAELASSQTLAIGNLRRRLGISESQLPCFHVAFIGYKQSNKSVTIPLSSRTVYDTVKKIVSHFDEKFSTIRQHTTRLENLGRSQRSSNRVSLYSFDHYDGSPKQKEAVRKIVNICKAGFSSQDEIQISRQECFTHLAVLKGTNVFRDLQRLIDVHLNYERETLRLKIEKNINASENELESSWKDVFRLASDITTVSIPPIDKYNIFIAYDSKERWIAESLHSALVQHTSTFIDTRSLRPGDRWVESIRSVQDNAKITIVLIGNLGATSWFQQAEYLRAIELVRAKKQRLVPIYTHGSPASVPYGLEGVQGIFKEWASGIYQDDVQKTAAEIVALIPNP